MKKPPSYRNYRSNGWLAMLIKNGKVTDRLSTSELGHAKRFIAMALEKGKCDFAELLYSHRTWMKEHD